MCVFASVLIQLCSVSPFSTDLFVDSYEQPTKLGIGEENIGNKLLQKMGWSSGMGLGKSNQGRTAPVEVCPWGSTVLLLP